MQLHEAILSRQAIDQVIDHLTRAIATLESGGPLLSASEIRAKAMMESIKAEFELRRAQFTAGSCASRCDRFDLAAPSRS